MMEDPGAIREAPLPMYVPVRITRRGESTSYLGVRCPEGVVYIDLDDGPGGSTGKDPYTAAPNLINTHDLHEYAVVQVKDLTPHEADLVADAWAWMTSSVGEDYPASSIYSPRDALNTLRGRLRNVLRWLPLPRRCVKWLLGEDLPVAPSELASTALVQERRWMLLQVRSIKRRYAIERAALRAADLRESARRFARCHVEMHVPGVGRTRVDMHLSPVLHAAALALGEPQGDTAVLITPEKLGMKTGQIARLYASVRTQQMSSEEPAR